MCFFGKEGIFGVEFEVGLIVGFVCVVFGNVYIVGGYVFYWFVVVVENFGCCKVWENFDI